MLTVNCYMLLLIFLSWQAEILRLHLQKTLQLLGALLQTKSWAVPLDIMRTSVFPAATGLTDFYKCPLCSACL